MLEGLDEIDLKPSLLACSRGRDFISVSNVYSNNLFFEDVIFFSNSLNKKRITGNSKIIEKKDRSPCLLKSK